MTERLNQGRIVATVTDGDLVIVAWREAQSKRVLILANQCHDLDRSVHALAEVFCCSRPEETETWLAAGIVEGAVGETRVRIRGVNTGHTLETETQDGVWMLLLSPGIISEPTELDIEDSGEAINERAVALGRLKDWPSDDGPIGYAPLPKRDRV